MYYNKHMSRFAQMKQGDGFIADLSHLFVASHSKQVT